MKKIFDSYFSLSKFERNGMIVLLVLIFIVIGINAFWPFIRSAVFNERNDLELLFKESENEFARLDVQNGDTLPDEHISELQAEDRAENQQQLFYFDPNKATESEWIKLGAGKKLARTIRNYITKGGRFRKSEDLQKIYGFNGQLYRRLSPWVKIENAEIVKKSKNTGFQTKNSVPEVVFEKININMAAAEQLTEIPGLNENFVIRMVKYRNLLGGFYSSEQIREVFGSKDDYVRLVEKYCFFNPDSVLKISLNNADLKTLGRHPYVGFDLAKKIIAFRNKNGPFQSLEGLKISGLVTDEKQYDKLFYYLKLWN